MTALSASSFASTTWWREHPQVDPSVVKAILSLSEDGRSAEEIWTSPSLDEWRHVAEVAARCDDEDGFDPVGWQVSWRMLFMLFQGEGESGALTCAPT